MQCNERFNVVDNNKTETVLIGNKTVKYLLSIVQNKVPKEIPVLFEINTGNSPPISWCRPIRRQKDQEDFKTLVISLKWRVLWPEVHLHG